MRIHWLMVPALVLLGACGGTSDGRTINGELVLAYSDSSIAVTAGEACVGRGGYADLNSEADVVIKNEDGKIIATSKLGQGKIEQGACRFTFAVEGVPEASFYSVEVSHRGELTYSRDELEEDGWSVALNIGD